MQVLGLWIKNYLESIYHTQNKDGYLVHPSNVEMGCHRYLKNGKVPDKQFQLFHKQAENYSSFPYWMDFLRAALTKDFSD